MTAIDQALDTLDRRLQELSAQIGALATERAITHQAVVALRPLAAAPVIFSRLGPVDSLDSFAQARLSDVAATYNQAGGGISGVTAVCAQFRVSGPGARALLRAAASEDCPLIPPLDDASCVPVLGETG